MNRIEQIFTDLRAQKRKALMPFLTAGDPDVGVTGQLLHALEESGASICELGIPFSDPIADGPVIQASMSYALDRGLQVQQVFDMVARERSKLKMGLVAMVSYSIVHRMGAGRFVKDAVAAGFDGFIFPDLPVEEGTEAIRVVREAKAICSFLIAPTTTPARAEAIAQACSGFVYVLSRAGITGEQKQLPADLTQRLERLQTVTKLPLAVGFGISTAEHVQQVVARADAAIVGSAMMRRVAEQREKGGAAVVEGVRKLTSELVAGLR